MRRRHVHRYTARSLLFFICACVDFPRATFRSRRRPIASNFRPSHSGRGTIFHPTASTAFWHMLHVSAGLREHNDAQTLDVSDENGRRSESGSMDTVLVWLRKGCLRLPASSKAAIVMWTGLVLPRSAPSCRRVTLKGRAASDPTRWEKQSFLDAAARITTIFTRTRGAHLASGVLQHFAVAFSREPEGKVLLQHKMKEPKNRVMLWRLLVLPTTYVYIAGSANQMPKDVRKRARDRRGARGA